MKSVSQVVGAVVLGLLAVAGIAFVFTYPFVLLMNYLFAPSFLLSVFGVAKIGFWRTFLLSIFTAFFFKSTK